MKPLDEIFPDQRDFRLAVETLEYAWEDASGRADVSIPRSFLLFGASDTQQREAIIGRLAEECYLDCDPTQKDTGGTPKLRLSQIFVEFINSE